MHNWYQQPLPSVINSHTSTNALWLKHSWVGDKQSEDAYRLLANQLKEFRVSDAFFHVGPLEGDGTITDDKYVYAKDLVDAMHRYYPELRVQAWMGQVEKMWGGPLDMSEPTVIKNILEESQYLMNLGFDGIHYNIEPIEDGSITWITLLEEAHKITRMNGKVLSVATDDLEPFWGAEKFLKIFSKNISFWSKEYYKKVAENVDQIAMMSYDTTLSEDYLYANYVYIQTKNLINLLPQNTVVFMGVPTYEDKRDNFHPNAENIYSALFGIRKALQDMSKSGILKREIGVAIYAEWTTDDKEWQFFKKHWIGEFLPKG
ncbi:MAG: hypothetical protein ACK4NC_02510 [Candidatus Gracilibacteria bacterium]